MTARVLRPVLTFTTVSALLVAALAVYFAFDADTTGADGGHFEATNTNTVTSTALSAPRGETNVLTVPLGDHNFSNVVTFEPLEVTLTPSCNIPGGRDRNGDGDAIDVGETTVCLNGGDSAGTQTSGATLGIVNGLCDSGLTVVHDLFAVETPNEEQAPETSTNIAHPRPEGSSDRFGGWAIGAPPLPAGGTAPVPGSDAQHAGGASLAIQNYPSFLLDLFDPDGLGGGANPVIPQAVYGGITSVAASWVPLYFVQFQSGQLNVAFAPNAPDPFSRFNPALGHPNQSVLNDPTATQANPSSITDFCSPLVANNTLLATVGGVTRATNPTTAGTHFTLHFNSGLRDLDNDGIENALDSCPRAANTENPRTGGSTGPDGDMLDSICDPSGIDVGFGDHDGDTFPNAQDNCPLVANGTVPTALLDSESNGAYSVSAFDGGTEGDSIGDLCEGGAAVAVTINGIAYSITPSATVGNGHYHIQANVNPRCYGPAVVDVDGDGYCAAQDAGADSGVCAAAPAPPAGTAPTCIVRHNAWTTTAAYNTILSGNATQSAPSFDTDRGGGDTAGPSDPGGIGTIACPTGTADLCPEVGFDSDWLEDFTGTDPVMPCSQNTGLDNEPIDAWIYDVNDDGSASLADLIAYGSQIGTDAFGKSYNAPFGTFNNDTVLPNTGTPRFDINSDGASNLSDLIAYGTVFNKFCNKVDGTNGTVQ